MTNQDKNTPQTEPEANNTQAGTSGTPSQNNPQPAQPDQANAADTEQNEGDYAIVGSGLGIDE